MAQEPVPGAPLISPDVIELRIIFDQTIGQIRVDGPSGNPLLYLGLLEMAKLALLEYRSGKPGRVLPIITLPPFVKQ